MLKRLWPKLASIHSFDIQFFGTVNHLHKLWSFFSVWHPSSKFLPHLHLHLITSFWVDISGCQRQAAKNNLVELRVLQLHVLWPLCYADQTWRQLNPTRQTNHQIHSQLPNRWLLNRWLLNSWPINGLLLNSLLFNSLMGPNRLTRQTIPTRGGSFDLGRSGACPWD